MKFNMPTLNLKLIDWCVRLVVIPLSVASITLAITNHQDNSVYGKLDFTKFKGFKYIVCISGVSGGYAFVAVVSSCFIKFLATKPWLFFLTDQVIAYLMITSVGGVGESIYLIRNGDREVSWSEGCSSYGSFCTKLNILLGLISLSFLLFLILAVLSAYRFFSLYQPPYMPAVEQQEEMI